MKIITVKELIYFCHSDDPKKRATLRIPKDTVLDAADRSSLSRPQYEDLLHLEKIESRKQGKIARLVPFFYSNRPDIKTFRTAIYGKEVIFYLRD